jgi:hypothetical protein
VEDPNVTMMKKLFSKISNSMTVASSRGVLLLENPGTLIDPAYDPANADDRFDWSRLVGQIPEPNWVYESSGTQLSDLWEILLRDKILPTEALSAAERQLLNDAYTVVRDANGLPSQRFNLYRYYERVHADAEDALHIAEEDYYNSGTPVPARLRRDVRIAEEDWVAFGHKDAVETALARIRSLQGRDPANWWANLERRFAESVETNGAGLDFHRIRTQPPREALDPGIRWTEYSFGTSDYQYQRESTHVSYGGGLSANFGLWRTSSGANYTRDQGFERSSHEMIDIKFEARRVMIDNYWLNPLVFETRSWGWAPNTVGAGLGYISDGDHNTNNGFPGGIMPLLPISLLLAKNVRVTGNFSEAERTWMREQINAGASFGWGPFSIGGHYSKQTERDYIAGSVTDTGFTSPQMQIIGWFCQPLGKTPDPDLGMTWPNEPERSDVNPLFRASRKAKVHWAVELKNLKQGLRQTR